MEKVKVLRLGGVVLVLSSLLALWPTIGLAQGDPHNGSWVLSVDKSKYTPGPGPKGQTSVYTIAGQSIKVATTGVDAAGKPTSTDFTANFDGKDYPVKGNPDYDMTSARRVDSNTIEFTRKRGGKVVQTATSVATTDGKTRTVTVTGVNAQGQKVNNVALYVKK